MHFNQASNNKVEFVNTLRGFAAISVVISHYFGVFWLLRSAVALMTNTENLSASIYTTPIYVTWLNKFPLFNWGAYGVSLFFLISGFVIPFSLQKRNGYWFCINRLFRILPVYIIGFSITLLALFLSANYFHTQWPYTPQEIFIHYIPGLRDVLWSRNIDGIIWTLEIEMKFYLVCAMAITSFRRYSSKIFVLPVILCFMACYCIHKLPSWEATQIWKLAMAYVMASQYIIFMFIGVIFHYMFCQKIELNKAYLGIAGLFFLFCIEWWAGPYAESLHLAWSYGFALLTFMFAYTYPRLFKTNPVFHFLAKISYPLYVIHGLFGYIVLRALLEHGYKTWLALTIVCSMVIMLSWILHKCIERPFVLLSAQLESRQYASRHLKQCGVEPI